MKFMHSAVLCCLVITLAACIFFSSRRRHTRYWRDWSSDVCSSDLWVVSSCFPAFEEEPDERQEINYRQGVLLAEEEEYVVVYLYAHHYCHGKIGRASCRERV